ncbi:hypothetical protein OGATHE_001075 [Ogataea polymorpha]|uniref:Uncharacterized protein n=1 Tax=Ogataea polymorpha TaxID=460523 RepID=A0A9P8PQW7_9ASCO|nr:hypothetical protein OGATHE_001075 [Ogataea polymorpha]
MMSRSVVAISLYTTRGLRFGTSLKASGSRWPDLMRCHGPTDTEMQSMRLYFSLISVPTLTWLARSLSDGSRLCDSPPDGSLPALGSAHRDPFRTATDSSSLGRSFNQDQRGSVVFYKDGDSCAPYEGKQLVRVFNVRHTSGSARVLKMAENQKKHFVIYLFLKSVDVVLDLESAVCFSVETALADENVAVHPRLLGRVTVELEPRLARDVAVRKTDVGGLLAEHPVCLSLEPHHAKVLDNALVVVSQIQVQGAVEIADRRSRLVAADVVEAADDLGIEGQRGIE